ncbi:23324_t:CDS:2 [Dentiscutata erythropus]|uniref:23324_t:CDS:1 n=1 Tax=Dentiscutata erythropus TaxID=1348616 RepID=A0A9N9NDS2_9GLOM|nr:23324_t:CDS:2 [Dentiscutata erythropus]
MSFNTLISGTQKKVRSSISSQSKKDESNDENKTLLLKIYEKLNKLETDFADMKKSQSSMEVDIKKIKEEICLLTNDKEFIEDIISNATQEIMNLNLYPSPEEFKKGCEEYIKNNHTEIYNSISRKWNAYYLKNIHTKLGEKLREF